MKAIVVLGCEGYTNTNIVFCGAVKNIILDLESIKHTENFQTLIKYFDHIKLFNGPTLSANIISNCLYKIFELGYFNEKQYKVICLFHHQHAKCCVRLEIKVKGELNE